MTQWIAFDDESVAALAKRTQAQVELGIGDAFVAALGAGAPAMVVLPNDKDSVSVLTIHHNYAVARRPAEDCVATGFLGLTDAPLVDDEEIPEKKSWWHRLWE